MATVVDVVAGYDEAGEAEEESAAEDDDAAGEDGPLVEAG